jgi:hypothetical protein
MRSDDDSLDVAADAHRAVAGYALAREYLDSGGTSGLPVIVFGPGCFRVPRWALIELITTGRVARLCDAPTRREDASPRG